MSLHVLVPGFWRWSRVSRLWLLALCLAAAPVIVAQEDGAPLDELRQLALETVSEDHGIPLENLEIGGWSTRELSLTAITLHRIKIIDTADGEAFALALDDLGTHVDAVEVLATERALHDAKYGPFEPAFFDRLMVASAEHAFRVALWLEHGDLKVPSRTDIYRQIQELRSRPRSFPPAQNGSGEEKDPEAERPVQVDEEFEGARQALLDAQTALRARGAEMLRAQVTELQEPILMALAEMGLTPVSVSEFAPLIYVEATKAQILALSELPGIDAIYGPHDNKDLMANAKPTQKGDVVDIWNFEGTNIDVAILEDSRIEFDNPLLNNGVTRVPNDANVDDHATSTAGMVASQDSVQQGVAQFVALFSANGTTYNDNDISDAMDWAAGTQNVDVINNSWGGNSGNTNLNEHDRHLDYIVRYQWSTVPVAAGNEAGACGSQTSRVTSPARGYNVISVGNYDDIDTLTWDDDVMSSCSSFVDPSTGCDKPEVAAVGSGITSTTASSPWIGAVGSGTSYAAPMVSGHAAQIMDVSNMTAFPEITKAIIMAGAVHNIEGSSRFSDKDGAGGIDMRAGVAIGDVGETDWRTVDSADFPYSIYVDCGEGEKIRGVICWDSNPNASYTTDPLEADIDLRVYDPSGSLVTSSLSFDNSFEVVEFTASTSGSYEFRIDEWTFDGSIEYVGFASFTGNQKLVNGTPESRNAPPETYDYFRAAGGSFWNAIAIRPDSDHDLRLHLSSPFGDPADYETVASSTLSGTFIDMVLFDRNHSGQSSYYAEVRNWSGSDGYDVQHASRIADIDDGDYGPYEMDADDVIVVFDTYVASGELRAWNVVQSSGDSAELRLFLFDSDPADSDSWYQRRSENVASSAAGAPGEPVSIEYTNSGDGDWHGLVIVNTAADPADFTVYSDTTPPTGSVTINGGINLTGLSRVRLDLSASDADLDITEMRIRNASGPWSGWLPYDTSTIWDLAPGAGNRTVEVQYRNQANLRSAIVSDSVTVYACPQPVGPLTNGDFGNATGLPWCFTDESDNGFAEYVSGTAVVTGGNDGASTNTQTYIQQRFTVGTTAPQVITFDWSYSSTNAPGFDGAFWDLIDGGTGLSVVGGPLVLADAGGSGSVVVTFAGSGTYEVRLGTYSTDNVFGPGVSVYDNVEVTAAVVGTEFIRGDLNVDGVNDISDVIFGLDVLFGGGGPVLCADASDVNDDGIHDLSDMIYLLSSLFSGGPDPVAPYPSCGLDPTDTDPLDCGSYPPCSP